MDLFFPKNCLGCGCPDTYLCRDCFTKIEIAQNNECFFCKKITWQGKICLNCQKENYLDRVISATNYGSPLIRELIKAFKYHYVQELAKPLSRLLIKSLENLEFVRQLADWNNLEFVVIPVPLYKHRLHSRGFNQAELLAKEVADYFKIPLKTDALKRRIPTIPQAKIKDIEKRRINLENVFEINSEQPVEEKIVILIDDVATTGATLVEAAKILKQNKAKEVWAITVAKG